MTKSIYSLRLNFRFQSTTALFVLIRGVSWPFSTRKNRSTRITRNNTKNRPNLEHFERCARSLQAEDNHPGLKATPPDQEGSLLALQSKKAVFRDSLSRIFLKIADYFFSVLAK
jgi:hypothetical protein